jgi:hypothetical protein
MTYDEPLSSPLASTFLVLFEEEEKEQSYSRFVRTNAPAIDVDIVERLHPNIAPLPTLVYDGETHRGYTQGLSRAWENWYCNTLPGRELPICKAILPKWFNSDYHSYDTEVRRDPVKGRSLFASKDIPKGNFILPHDAGLALRIDAQRWEALNKFVEDFPDAHLYKQIRDFFIAYGYESEQLGLTGWAVSIACNNTFTNHACTEQEKGAYYLKESYLDEDGEYIGFSPPLYRKAELFSVLVEAIRDIKAGEEIMVDYAAFRSEGNHEDFNKFLENMCTAGIGLVAVDDEQDGADEL